MVQISPCGGWDLGVERGPDWLFVQPRCSGETAGSELGLVEHIWTLLEQNRTYRLVLELEAIEFLTPELIDQLASLQKRVHAHDGTLRLCGLSEENAAAVERLPEFGPVAELLQSRVGSHGALPPATAPLSETVAISETVVLALTVLKILPHQAPPSLLAVPVEDPRESPDQRG